MQITNSLNNIQNITPNRTLQRTQSSPALIEGRSRRDPIRTLLEIETSPNHFLNTEMFLKNMSAIGLNRREISNIHNLFLRNEFPRDNDDTNTALLRGLNEARIEPRGFEGLKKASTYIITQDNIPNLIDNHGRAPSA